MRAVLVALGIAVGLSYAVGFAFTWFLCAQGYCV